MYICTGIDFGESRAGLRDGEFNLSTSVRIKCPFLLGYNNCGIKGNYIKYLFCEVKDRRMFLCVKLLMYIVLPKRNIL